MPLNIGLQLKTNQFDSDIDDQIELRNSIVVYRKCHDLSGAGFGSFLSSLFSRGVKLYNKAKPIVKKGLQAYDTASKVASAAKDIYQSSEVQRARNLLPPSVQRKEQELLKKAKPFYEKAKSYEGKAREAYKDAQPYLREAPRYAQEAQNYANQIDQKLGLEPKAEKLPGDGLRSKLLRLERHKGRGTRLAGQGTYLPGAGTALAGGCLKMGLSLVPKIIEGIQRGSGLSSSGKRQLTQLTQQHLRSILPGVRTPQHLASAVLTPLKLIHQSGSGSKAKRAKGARYLKQFEKEIERKLKAVNVAHQQGRGVSTSDVLSTIGNIASVVLPFLL